MHLLGPDPVLDQRTRQQEKKRKRDSPSSIISFDVNNQLMGVMHVNVIPINQDLTACQIPVNLPSEKMVNNQVILLFRYALNICGLEGAGRGYTVDH